jgi:hypothetical protein
MEMNFKSNLVNKNLPDFMIEYNDGLYISIVDLDKGNVSVTNSIEYVIDQIKKEHDLVGKKVVYSDSDGIYDAIVLNESGSFSHFLGLRQSTLELALDAYKKKLAL